MANQAIGYKIASSRGGFSRLLPTVASTGCRASQLNDQPFSGPWAWAWGLGLGLGLGFDGLLQKADPVLGLSIGLDKHIAKCGNCEREPRESNISRLYVEIGV
jgi:hypothetical protein